jgi:hypothetical protein
VIFGSFDRILPADGENALRASRVLKHNAEIT